MKRLLVVFVFAAGCSSGSTNNMDMGTCSTPGPRPSARKDVEAVLVPETREVYIYGGDGAPFDNTMPIPLPKQLIDDMWRYNLGCGTWEPLTTTGTPGQRGGYAATYDSKRGRLILFGGYKGGTTRPPLANDTWAFDIKTLTWTQLMSTGTPPTARVGHRIAYDATADRVILFAGDTRGSFNPGDIVADTWELSFATSADGRWIRLFASGSAGSPTERRDPTLALDGAASALYAFGGAVDFAGYSDEMWIFDLPSSTWRQASVTGVAPSPRFQVGMRQHAASGRFVLFGGHDPAAIGLMNDTYTFLPGTTGRFDLVLDGDQGLRVQALVDRNSPERRDKHGMVMDGDKVWIFGGTTDCGPTDDVWTLDMTNPSSWQNVYPAKVGETCARRAEPGQMCSTDCGPPL